jgi:hypothetical protein
MLNHRFGGLFARGCAAQQEALKARTEARRLCASLGRFRRGVSPRPSVAAVWTETLRTDSGGLIVSANEGLARWLRVSADRIVGMRLLNFVARRDTRAFRGMVKKLGYPESDGSEMVHFRPRGGRPELVHASVTRAAPNGYDWTLRAVDSPGALEPTDPTQHA